jgi:hypothetical protein
MSKYNKIAAVSIKASLVHYYHKNDLSTNNVKSVGMITNNFQTSVIVIKIKSINQILPTNCFVCN